MIRTRSLSRFIFSGLPALCAAFWITAPAGYAADITIVRPRNQETIHDNSGTITVTVKAATGDRRRVVLLLDGRPAGPASSRTTITLGGIDRGEHTLEALLVDEKDAVLATSTAVTFHVWRASSQFPARKPTPTPSPPSPSPAKP